MWTYGCFPIILNGRRTARLHCTEVRSGLPDCHTQESRVSCAPNTWHPQEGAVLQRVAWHSPRQLITTLAPPSIFMTLGAQRGVWDGLSCQLLVLRSRVTRIRAGARKRRDPVSKFICANAVLCIRVRQALRSGANSAPSHVLLPTGTCRDTSELATRPKSSDVGRANTRRLGPKSVVASDRGPSWCTAKKYHMDLPSTKTRHASSVYCSFAVSAWLLFHAQD